MMMPRWWKIVLVLALVFGAGVMAGLAWSTMQAHRGFMKALEYEHWVEGGVDHLRKELSLTPEQLPKVRALVEKAGQRIKANLKECGSECLGILDEFDDELAAELTVEQKAIQQAKRAEFREHVKTFLGLEAPGRIKPDPK
jgi:hypothetical protein